MVNIQKLNKAYASHKVFRDLDLVIPQGAITGLVGENGAGKTTLFECLYGVSSYEGTIEFTNCPKIGYLPSSLYFYPNMLGIEYIEFCLAARKQVLNKTTVNELNESFSLPLNKYATVYSTGMKKKLALMALILQKNDFYIMDEPFNGLDLSSSLLLKQFIRQIKNRKKTVLVSSHIIASLTDICDTIEYLKNGVIYNSYIPGNFDKIEEDILLWGDSKLPDIDF